MCSPEYARDAYLQDMLPRAVEVSRLAAGEDLG